MNDMTSAFILPDITMRHPTGPAMDTVKATQEVFDSFAPHDNANCTICNRVLRQGEKHAHDQRVKNSVTVPKPVPVSDRKDELPEDATMRPSQPPALALAIVLKGLEDELAHQKAQLAQYQAVYNQHDPSLSKRKRKAVFSKIEKLLQLIDIKADQIYALYDVLEGQKADGHEMTQGEVEVTLKSVGIDLDHVDLRGGGLEDDDGVDDVRSHKSGKSGRSKWELQSEDSDDELPWEGFEDTIETRKSGLTGKSFGADRRSSWF
jgi:hypothetical protein